MPSGGNSFKADNLTLKCWLCFLFFPGKKHHWESTKTHISLKKKKSVRVLWCFNRKAKKKKSKEDFCHFRLMQGGDIGEHACVYACVWCMCVHMLVMQFGKAGNLSSVRCLLPGVRLESEYVCPVYWELSHSIWKITFRLTWSLLFGSLDYFS